MPARKYSDSFERRICDAYRKGEGVCSIARRLHVIEQTVSSIVRRHGMQRTRSGSIKQQILAAYKPDLSTSQIAKEVNTSRSYVFIVLNECGLYQGRAQ